MHRCLGLVEILSIVSQAAFEDRLSGGQTLCSLAQTCRSFHEPAIAVLWHTQSSIVPLLKCMPRDLWSNPIIELFEDRRPFTFRRNIVPTDWPRFHHYARHVHRLGYETGHDFRRHAVIHPSVYHELDALKLVDTLLPNLRELSWTDMDSRSFQFIRLFLGRRLATLQSRLVTFDPNGQVSRLLHSINSISPRLKELKLDAWHPFGAQVAFSPALSDLVCHLQELETLFCGTIPLTGPAFRRLALSRSLRELHIHTGAATLCEHLSGARSPSNPFPSLRTLAFPARDLIYGGKLLKLMDARRLQTLDINIDTVPTASEMRDFFLLLRAQYEGRYFIGIKIHHDSLGSEVGAIYESREYEVTAGTLAPLKALRLTSCNLHVPVPFQLYDSDLAYLGAAWPGITSLRLGACSNWRGKCILSLFAMDGLARRCPRLESIAVVLDANITYGILDEMRLPRTENLLTKTLSLGNSPLDDAAFVSYWLSKLFPNLENIEAWSDVQTGDEEGQSYARKWEEVKGNVRSLRIVRDEVGDSFKHPRPRNCDKDGDDVDDDGSSTGVDWDLELQTE